MKNVCLRAWGFWNLRTHTIYASCVLVRSLRIQCSRVLNVLILNVKAPMRSSIRIWPSSWEMSDKHWVVLFGSHCFRGMAKTRIAGFVGLRCSFRAIGTSASVEQRLREFMPLCLDSNTRGHVLLSRLPQRRACMFWLGVKPSRATTRRRVKEFGYGCCQRRLTLAKEKKNWTVVQWSKVLFSDENKFCI